MSGWAVFLILVLIAIILGFGGWIIFTQLRARRLGLPAPSLLPIFNSNARQSQTGYAPPAPAPGGIQGWISSKIDSLRGSNRTAGGAYESTGYAGGSGPARTGRRGFGALDPDEAWDARVGNEAGYYEEQELGVQDPAAGPYGGGGYGGGTGVGVGGIEEGRGRSRSRQRELDHRYDEEVHGGGQARDPFADEAERSDMSLRGVSPRPVVDTQAARGHKAQQSLGSGSADNSPTERRSMFRENM